MMREEDKESNQTKYLSGVYKAAVQVTFVHPVLKVSNPERLRFLMRLLRLKQPGLLLLLLLHYYHPLLLLCVSSLHTRRP